MEFSQIRKAFLEFFEKRGHKVVPSSSLLPTDPSVLFTTAGMQQFKEYYLERESPYGNRVVSCQKCFRTSDIDEVGDSSHLTFLEMLGNFSFAASAEASGEGGESYFKEEAISWAYEFMTKEMSLEIDYVSVFAGDKNVPEDKESQKIWINLGIPKEKIKKFGREDNFWGPTGEEGPCGPTSEVYIKGVEVWNLVFNEYFMSKDKKLTFLKKKGIDTGMGLERLAMMVQKKNNVFETDLFEPILRELRSMNHELKDKGLIEKSERIIADHIKSSVFLASEGIMPSNVERGYVLRRILRRAIRYGKVLDLPKNFLIPLAKKVIEIYQENYPVVKSKETDILTAIQNEEEKFEKTLERGLKELNKMIEGWKGEASRISESTKPFDRIRGESAFYIYETYGFPLELIQEEFTRHLLLVDEKEFKDAFDKAHKAHQEISRAGAEKKFGGVGENASYEQAKLHTATHLLHQALREVLGSHVGQMGSDINPQRLRFDFSHPAKMTAEEIRKTEDLVNQKIKENLEIKKEEMDYQKALGSGALAFFKEKYPEKVNVYSIGTFSKEICAGPHVNRTSELGRFKIVKEESSGAGVRRIRATLE
ncbi:MAG: alanine--tRNA ligase [Candidatus Nealsonbacteria bacterium CG23_combo_of_CG06-09_8_20_14_all_38_19]|uniref:alanine--tRNA ligase n=1 Tax=Candidatus Nealsonbacteria bacterium CG23_combo_of_CG06-09_8_20_14_all_38_19 TaxID=1974721 RepID=A0A2G9YWE2_9BACT|nr:MAG: alanine--tRNA ligase [Candidatus Nealsonbacteria bacterium CG23_combo_of_CG06-09_8_20_14_all_38_19]